MGVLIIGSEAEIAPPRERPLTPHEQSDFESYREDAWALLSKVNPHSTPEMVVRAVDAYVQDWHRGGGGGWMRRLFGPSADATRTALAMGTLWGEQFVARFHWSWGCLNRQGVNQYFVGARDRSLVVYPAQYVKACLDTPGSDCTAALAFNMVAAGSVPVAAPQSRQNLMEGLRRIVPRG